jgi:hypothetical protein
MSNETAWNYDMAHNLHTDLITKATVVTANDVAPLLIRILWGWGGTRQWPNDGLFTPPTPIGRELRAREELQRATGAIGRDERSLAYFMSSVASSMERGNGNEVVGQDRAAIADDDRCSMLQWHWLDFAAEEMHALIITSYLRVLSWREDGGTRKSYTWNYVEVGGVLFTGARLASYSRVRR